MSDPENVDPGGDDSAATGTEGEGAEKKKVSGLAALLPNLLKYAAIGLGALIVIVTVVIIVVNIMNKGGAAQTVILDPTSPYVAKRPEYSMFTLIGQISTRTKDTVTPSTVMVDMILAYDLDDLTASTELTTRVVELKDFVRHFFSTKYAADLTPEGEAKLKQEIKEQLNTRLLNTARVREIFFKRLDVVEM
jgi:flagellar FliL protein